MALPRLNRAVRVEQREVLLTTCPVCGLGIVGLVEIAVSIGDVTAELADGLVIQVATTGTPRSMTVRHDCEGNADGEPKFQEEDPNDV